ncbi:succinate dehydrogenase cytochrome b subunit [Propioniciclava sp.]|uniref:succinate dehydrogenase cytochrome b subunit n=1 Tax=Propioniciclava sp. TaxID=2038686 RepID=UPI002607A4F5|nr:succinate dehydrogenase cytochrome b subunit [Propioniciclava sp.]
MATTTLTPHQRAVRSSVALKVLMAITGLIMVGFLLMHMYGNLKVFLGADAFNHYAHWLKGEILYPLVPEGWFIWIFRAFMLAAIVGHVYAAAVLTKRSLDARSSKYVHGHNHQETYAARTMRWGGVILLTGLIFHLLQFTAHVVRTGFSAGDEPFDMVHASFSQWWLVLAYAVWVLVVCLHVRHGVWSALTTLGANTSPKARGFLNGLAWVIAVTLFVGFMIMPVAVLLGWV